MHHEHPRRVIEAVIMIFMKTTTRIQCPTLLREVARVLLCFMKALSRFVRHAWDTVELVYP